MRRRISLRIVLLRSQSHGSSPATSVRESCPDASQRPTAQPAIRAASIVLQNFRNRLISGLVFCSADRDHVLDRLLALLTIQRFVLDPLAGLINQIPALDPELSRAPEPRSAGLVVRVASPILAVRAGRRHPLLPGPGLAIVGLPHDRLVPAPRPGRRHHLPGGANVVESLGSQFQGGAGFKRVVLVEFPHPGMRSLGLVTNSLHDATTGRTILTVCVMTGIMPPTGFTLFVPEDRDQHRLERQRFAPGRSSRAGSPRRRPSTTSKD